MHITIIDDEKLLANKIMKKLQNQGYAVSAFYGFEHFMQSWDANSQLYIVDLSLRDGSGFDIIHWLRKEQKSKAPIVIISGYGDSQNKIYWLDIWADDYLTKPVIPEELLARVKAILRRPVSLVTETLIRYKDISFDTNTKEIRIWDKKIYLTKNESLVLEFFISNHGKIINKERLVSHVWWWHSYSDVTDNTINVTLSNVRKKLGQDFTLKTLYNQWYILE